MRTNRNFHDDVYNINYNYNTESYRTLNNRQRIHERITSLEEFEQDIEYLREIRALEEEFRLDQQIIQQPTLENDLIQEFSNERPYIPLYDRILMDLNWANERLINPNITWETTRDLINPNITWETTRDLMNQMLNYEEENETPTTGNINETSDDELINPHDEFIDVCSICLDDVCDIETTRKLRCGHHFHIDCIRTWLTKNKSCPLCRQHFTK
jgi:hypothetical protein